MLEPAAPIRTSQGIFELGYNLFVRCEYCTYKHVKYNIQRRGKRGPRQRIEAAKPRNPGEAAKPWEPHSGGAPGEPRSHGSREAAARRGSRGSRAPETQRRQGVSCVFGATLFGMLGKIALAWLQESGRTKTVAIILLYRRMVDILEAW